ncbi:unnamed protein product, partial [Didymodactylos carnosus]
QEDGDDNNTIKITDIISTKPLTNTTTIIKTITLEEAEEDGGNNESRNPLKVAKQTAITINQPAPPQFKQFEPLKVKFPSRDHSKEFTSSSSSSADTIVTVGMRANTPASRYGGYYSIYHGGGAYSGSITPSSCHSTAFEMMHIESLREKLNRLTRESQNLTSGRADLDDNYGSPRVLRIKDDGKTTPTTSLSTEFFQKKSLSREPIPSTSLHQPGDYGIVNIVKELPGTAGTSNENDRSSVHLYTNGGRVNSEVTSTTHHIVTHDEANTSSNGGIMETIIQDTYISPAKLDFNKLNEEQQQTIDKTPAVSQLAEGARQTIDDIREYLLPNSSTVTNNTESKPESINNSPQPLEILSSPSLPLDQPILPEEKPATRTPNVAERLSKSKIIPEPARALANALKHAVVKPLKKTMNKMKSFDSTPPSTTTAIAPVPPVSSNELSSTDIQKVPQETTLEYTTIRKQHPAIVHSLSLTTPPVDYEKNSDVIKSELISPKEHTLSEPSTPTTISPDSSTLSQFLLPSSPPAKPPRHSDSSSSIETSVPLSPTTPPQKPPRHFIPDDNIILDSNSHDQSLIDNQSLIQQTDSVVKKVLNIVDTFGMPHNGDNDVELLKQQISPPPIYIQQPSNDLELKPSFDNPDVERIIHTHDLEEEIVSNKETQIQPQKQDIVNHSDQFKSHKSNEMGVKNLVDIVKHIREAIRRINHSQMAVELKTENYRPLNRSSIVPPLHTTDDVHRFKATPGYIPLMSDKSLEPFSSIPDQPNVQTVTDLSTATSLLLEPQQNIATEIIDSSIEVGSSQIHFLPEQNELDTVLSSHIINPFVGPISSQQSSISELNRSLSPSVSSQLSSAKTIIPTTVDTYKLSPVQISLGTLPAATPNVRVTATSTDVPRVIEEATVETTSISSSIDPTNEAFVTHKTVTVHREPLSSASITETNPSNDKDIIFRSTETTTNVEKISEELQRAFDEENKTETSVDKIRAIDTMINKDRQHLLEKLLKFDNTNQSGESNVTTTLTSLPTLTDSVNDQTDYASESSGRQNTFLDSFKTGLDIQEQLTSKTAEDDQAKIGVSANRPLMFVSVEPGFNLSKVFSPLTDLTKTSNNNDQIVQQPSISTSSPTNFCPPSTIPNETPSSLVTTTSVTVISRADPMVNSISTTSSAYDDDLTLTGVNSSLMPNASDGGSDYRNRSLRSKESSIDSVDTTAYDNVQQIRSGTPRSLVSDYDNLHGSFVSLNESQTTESEQQQQQQQSQPSSSSLYETASSPSITLKSNGSSESSDSTQYESFDIPTTTASSLSNVYQSALSTLNSSSSDFSDHTATPEMRRLSSEISDDDEDFVENADLETPTPSFKTNINQFKIFNSEYNPSITTLSTNIVEAPPIIEITEDNNEPIDEDDMSFLTDVLEQYKKTKDNMDTSTKPSEVRNTAVGEEQSASILTSFSPLTSISVRTIPTKIESLDKKLDGTSPSVTLPNILPIQPTTGITKTSVSFQRLSKYSRPADEVEQASPAVNTNFSSISTIPSYSTSSIGTREIRSQLMETSSELLKKMSKTAPSTVSSQHQQPVSSTADHIQSNWLEDRRAYQNEEQQQISPKTRPARMSPPTKLSFEQNITNLEKESPLLQSELLTAEHELSALKSRLAVTEGITAVTSTILESLKEHFELPTRQVEQIDAALISTRENVDMTSGRNVCGDLSSEPTPKIPSFNKSLVSGVSSHSIPDAKPAFTDQATSPIQEFNISSSPLISIITPFTVSSQTSPMIENVSLLPSLTNELTGEPVEIHYDAITNQQTSFLVKTRNSFWIANHIPTHEAQNRLQTMSSPVMKRATVKLPESMDQFLSDSDVEFVPQVQQKLQQQVIDDVSMKQFSDFNSETHWSIESIAGSEKFSDRSVHDIKEFASPTKDGDKIICECNQPLTSESFEHIRSPLTEQNINIFNRGSIEKKQLYDDDTWSTEVLAPSVVAASEQELLTIQENEHLSSRTSSPLSDLEQQVPEESFHEDKQYQPTQVVDETTVLSEDKLIQQDSLTQLYENISASITEKVLSTVTQKQQETPTTIIQSEPNSQSPPLAITPDRETSYDTKEQLSEMMKIRSAPSENRQQLEELEVKVEELYSILDHMLHQKDKEISTEMNEFELKVDELTVMNDIDMKKQDEDRIELEIDELHKIILSIHAKNQINFDILPNAEQDYELATQQLVQERRRSLELLEENVNELRQIIHDISTISSRERPHSLALTTDNQVTLQPHKVTTPDEEIPAKNLIEEFEDKTESVQNVDYEKEWTPEQMAEYFRCTPDGKRLSSPTLKSETLQMTSTENTPQSAGTINDTNQKPYSLNNLAQIIYEMREPQHATQQLIAEDPIVSTDVFYEGDRSFHPEEKVTTHLVPESPRVSSDVFYEGDRSHSLFENTENLKSIVQNIIEIGEQQKNSTAYLIPEEPVINRDVFYEGSKQQNLYETDIDNLNTIVDQMAHNVKLEPEEPRITANIFYEGDTKRSLYHEDNEQSTNGGLYQIISDIHNRPLESDNEELLVESFLTTEIPAVRGNGLYEIIHEIENFPLSSNTTMKELPEDDRQQLSPHTIDFMNTIKEAEQHSTHDETAHTSEKEYILPFSQEPSIVIHRTILTRNDTLYEPEKISVDSEQTSPVTEIESQKNEVLIFNNESTPRSEDIDNRETVQSDWTISQDQHQEIYGEQHPSERKFISELTAHENVVPEHTLDVSTHIVKDIQEQPVMTSNDESISSYADKTKQLSPTQVIPEFGESIEELVKIASSLRNFQKPISPYLNEDKNQENEISYQIPSYKTDEYLSSDEEINVLKRPDEWTHSSFQKQEIYGDKYRPEKSVGEDQIDYAMESPEVEVRLMQEISPSLSGLESIIRDISNDNFANDENQELPFVSRIQRASIISRTIQSNGRYSDETGDDWKSSQMSDDNQLYTTDDEFRPTHLEITTSPIHENQPIPFQTDFPVLSDESMQQL